MKVAFNEDILLWAIGVLQPTSGKDALKFISLIYHDVSPLPTVKKINKIIAIWEKLGYLAKVHKKAGLYSLTNKANYKLSVKLRRHRDKVRLFLLKDARNGKLGLSGEGYQELVGESPTVDGSRGLQESRPIKLGAALESSSQLYWSRIFEQRYFKAGFDITAPDINLKLYSFPSFDSIHSASGEAHLHNDLNYSELALAIGISPRLITSLSHASTRHYREFKIGKKGGGERIISAPRIFLKTVQYWIMDYLLQSLKIHQSCHSYQKGKSILTNANPHAGQRYVANIDIVDFFGSISQRMVKEMLINNGLGKQISKVISQLVTLKDSLPQGAPTSPLISNALLYHFDKAFFEFSRKRGLVYSRYADDMTISGESKNKIVIAIKELAIGLKKSFGLRINHKKTRIASRGGQQKVTGIVVNSEPVPPRAWRRRVRAMFHQASMNSRRYKKRVGELKGYLSYLNSFPTLRDRDELNKYQNILQRIKGT